MKSRMALQPRETPQPQEPHDPLAARLSDADGRIRMSKRLPPPEATVPWIQWAADGSISCGPFRWSGAADRSRRRPSCARCPACRHSSCNTPAAPILARGVPGFPCGEVQRGSRVLWISDADLKGSLIVRSMRAGLPTRKSRMSLACSSSVGIRRNDRPRASGT